MLRWLRYWTKVTYSVRGWIFRWLVILAGGSCGPGLRVEQGLRLRQGLHGGLCFGTKVYLGRNITIDCPPPGVLSIGDNVTLTESIFISCCEKVTIGRDTLIGEFCSIRDANHEFGDLRRPIGQQPMVSKPISIGTDVWIGRGCAVLSGVQIGSGAVVGANSVVTRTIEDRAIAFGSPAKTVRLRG